MTTDTVRITVSGTYSFEGQRWYFAKDTNLSPLNYPYSFLHELTQRGYAEYIVPSKTEVVETVVEEVNEPVTEETVETLEDLIDDSAVVFNATDSAIILANSYSINLADVVGTGTGGRILKKDVEMYLAKE
jgi:pyruvate/2-oxoglutarate dehydrogenase complex dihydrolipoamide acyltransferase (E2) component